jgi:CRP-like cAMP-binding protein
MDNEQARAIMSAHVREQFGHVLDLREVSVVRRASGRTWRGDLVCVTRWGEVPAGQVVVHEDGRVIETCSVDSLVDALVQVHPAVRESMRPPSNDASADLFADLGATVDDTGPDLTFEMGDDLDDALGSLCEEPNLREQIRKLKASDRAEDLEAARELLPKLLSDGESRRYTLVEMGDVELRLGHKELALQYLEAAAREFADRSEIRALELVASIALRVLGEELFAVHAVKHLLDFSRRRVRPIEHLGQAPVFAGMSQNDLARIEALATPLTLTQGQIALQEGAEALRAFVIKSGILSIRLETPEGGSRVVRCSFPGSLVGETSVLGAPGSTCTATVKAESVTALWSFDGSRLRDLCDAMPILRTRLEGARALHRLDSFFSMHETTQTLDARMRDRILACVTEIRHAQQNELLNTPGEVPSVVYLVAEGAVEYAADDAQTRVLRADSFIGLRDALHGIRTDGTFVSAEDSLLVCFDADKLREVAADAPPDVVAVIERLD